MLIFECKDVLIDVVLWVVLVILVLMIFFLDCVDKDVYCFYWKVYCDRNIYVFENCWWMCKFCYVLFFFIILFFVVGLC